MEFVIVVDPYASGTLIAPRLRELEFVPVAVHSKDPQDSGLENAWRKDDFDVSIIAGQASVKQVANAIVEKTGRSPKAVINGSEYGTFLADTLADYFNVAGNSPQTSNLRTNKYFMHETLREKGIPSVKQLLTTNPVEALEWVYELALPWCVLKPAASAATENVRIIPVPPFTDRAILQKKLTYFFEEIIGKYNDVGRYNSEVLVQERLVGTEYAIDSVTVDGKHFITDMYRYDKSLSPTGAPICHGATFVEFNGFDSMMTYLPKVLDALQVMVGATHTEVMMTSHGPILMEVGARLSGFQIPTLVEHCWSHSLLDLTIASHTDPAKFHSMCASNSRLIKHGTLYLFSMMARGTLVDIPVDQYLPQLASYLERKWYIKPSDTVEITQDAINVAGWVMLAHEKPEVVRADVEKLRAFEEAGETLHIE